ncbi:MAG: sulfatase-like hydrolase/transferase [Acidobacteria bacterium]|nr:sulfatase-like hydrolase/transferase [Acidobacteriota bacterium]
MAAASSSACAWRSDWRRQGGVTIHRREFNRALAGGLFAAAGAGQGVSRPNIVFLLTDDQRRDSLGCYGNREIRTPHIDRLAGEGVLFERAFVTSAICTPSRASYFLGQYERRHGVNFNSGTSLAPAAWEDSYPMRLRKSGYFTGYVGKNHVPLGPRGYQSGILEKSFDFWYAGHQHLTFYPKQRHPIFRFAKAGTQPEVLEEGALSFLDSQGAFIAGAEAFLKQRPANQPFCLSLCFNLPHRAGTGSMRQLPADRELYRTAYRDRINEFALPGNYIPKAGIRAPRIPANVLYAQFRQNSYNYVDTEAALREHQVRVYQTVTGIDDVLGALRGQLKKLGLERNTVIVFASDHGIMAGEFGLGGKALNYEPCLRIPMIVMDPRLPEPRRGQRLGQLVQSIDVAPTLVDLAGLPAPAAMQGRSLAPLLRGEKVPWREYVFAENLWSTTFGNPRVESVRSADWKYIRYFATGRSLFQKSEGEQARAYLSWLTASVRGLKPDYEELFHVAADPNETANLARDPKNAPMLARMREECDRQVREAKGDLDAPPLTLPLPAGATATPAE